MPRFLLLALAALAVSPGFAWGQVAAPSLLPARPGIADATVFIDPSFVPVNAAILAWPGQSSVGFGVIRSSRETEPFTYAGPPLPAGMSVVIKSQSFSYEGSYGGGTVHGDRYGLAAETYTVKDVAGDERLDTYASSVAGARRFGDSVSVGVGYSVQGNRDNNTKSRSSGYSAGASVRILDRLYLGAVAGQDQVKNEATTADGTPLSGQRTSYGGGAAYLSQGPVGLHFEVWAASLGSVKNKDQVGAGGGTVEALIAEAKVREFVMGYTAQHVNSSFEAKTAKAELDGLAHEVSVGVVAEHGFAVLFHYGFSTMKLKYTFTESDVTSNLTTDAKSRTITLVWQY